MAGSGGASLRPRAVTAVRDAVLLTLLAQEPRPSNRAVTAELGLSR